MEPLSAEQREQIAYEKGSLPRFIFVGKNEPSDFVEIITNFDCVSTEGQLINPLHLYDEINNTARVKLTLEDEDIFKLFTIANTRYITLVEGTDDTMRDLFLFSQGEIGETLIREWNARAETTQMYQQELEKFRVYFTRKIEQRRVLENAAPFVPEKFTTVSRSVTYQFKKKATLLDIFNDLNVSKDLPLISTRDYYKVLKGYAYYLDHPDEEDVMYLFYKGERVTLKWNKDYVDPEFELTYKSGEDIDEYKSLIGFEASTIVKRRQDAEITLYPPQLRPFDFNRYIWADLIMNNPSVSSNFVINELERIGSVRPQIFMYYFPEGAASTIEQEVKAKKLSFVVRAMSLIDKEKSGIFLTKIILRFHDWSEEDLAAFVPKICKVFGLYLSEAQAIAAIYNKYLDLKIKLTPPEPETKKRRLKEIEPKLFLPGYVRNQCQFGPDIVQQEEAQEYEEKGYQVMIFPKTDNEDLEQRYYVCNKYEKNIFPGLQDNKMKNKDKYKYVPCCFKDDQLTKDSRYRSYMYPGIETESANRAGYIETGKILLKDQKGAPPSSLKRLFSLLGAPTAINRVGTVRNTASIIECITNDSRRVDRMRARLASLEENALNVSAQEMAQIGGVEAARAILANKDMYLDPRAFFRLLELYFDCRLILLGKDDFIFPNYLYTFVHFYSEAPIVVAYENFGGGVALADYPQWEIFEGISASLAEELYSLYSKDFVRYKVNRRGELETLQEAPQKEAPERRIEITAQHLNSYCQTIALNIRDTTYVLAAPIPPLSVPITTEILPAGRAPPIDVVPVRYGKYYYIIRDLKPFTSGQESWLDDFIAMKEESTLLVEQAKYLASRGESLKVSGESLKGPIPKTWVNSLKVPEKVAMKLNYSVRLFQKNKKETFVKYKDYKIIPNRFTSVVDFTPHREEIISNVDYRVDWSQVTPILEEKPLVNREFYIELDARVYFCRPIKDLPDVTDVNMYIFNTKQLLKVGAPEKEDITFLFFLTALKRFHVYECRRVFSEYS